MFRTLTAALALAFAAAPAPAGAQSAGPAIEHEPVSSARAGAPLVMEARIRTGAGRTAFEPTVFVRVTGLVGYTRVAMRPAEGEEGMFRAEVPAALVTGDFDYYLETFDSEGDGPARVGAPETPLRVLVTAAPPAQTDKPAAARLAPPRPQEVEALVVPSQPRITARPRSHLPTFLLFAATGLSLGLATFATVGQQMMKSELDRSLTGEEQMVGGGFYQTGQTLGQVSVGGFAAAGVFLTSGIVYLAWPDAEPESSVAAGGTQP